MRKNIVLITLCFLCACDPSLTMKDNEDLNIMRRFWKKPKDQPYEITYDLIKEKPEALAQKSLANGDSRPIGIAMGYMAQEKDATPIGLKCNKPIQMNTIFTGCVPPPDVIFKLAYRYNQEIFRNSDISSAFGCSLDTDFLEAITESRNERHKQKVDTWLGKNREERSFNN